MDNKSSKNLNIALILLFIITICIGIFLYYKIKDNNKLSKEIEEIKLELNKDKKIDNFNLNEEKNNKVVEYNNISGVYTYSLNIDKEDGYICELYLFENGTFKYEYCSMYAVGVIGNYIIKGNTIVLNKLFETGSDIGLTVTEGETILNLNNDGTISNIDKILNDSYFENDLSNVKLTKLSKNEEKEYIELLPNINEILYYSVFSNKIDEIVE